LFGGRGSNAPYLIEIIPQGFLPGSQLDAQLGGSAVPQSREDRLAIEGVVFSLRRGLWLDAIEASERQGLPYPLEAGAVATAGQVVDPRAGCEMSLAMPWARSTVQVGEATSSVTTVTVLFS